MMPIYRRTGTDASGCDRLSVLDLGTQGELLTHAVKLLDDGWTALSITNAAGTEVAGIQDFGGDHYEAWVANP